jgi:hypothetical protein
MITNAQRRVSTTTGWHISHATVSLPPENEEIPLGVPFPDSQMNKVLVDTTKESCHVISPALFDYSDINNALGTFAVSTYVYPYGESLTVEIGYEGLDEDDQEIADSRSFIVDADNTWAFVSETFIVPINSKDIKIKIQVHYEDVLTGYFFYLNGITVGQASERFHAESLGQDVEAITGSIFSGYGLPAQTYGINSTEGYYISYKNMLCASNDSMPMVKGSDSSTRLTRNPDGPSLIIPGYGFMNESGKFKDLTIEMWLRIQSDTSNIRKIFGPLSSDDGLYVSDSFLILRVGKNSESYFISEWDRPMLVAIRLSLRRAAVTINGEEVISIDLSRDTPVYPDKFSEDNKNQDWLGFYCYTDVPSMDVDCIGIYPYMVSNIVEKRRWIYGQGVGAPSENYGATLGNTVAIDYANSKYAKNYLYPDIGKFEQGINENLRIEAESISLPNYRLPEVVFSNKSSETWYKDVEAVQDPTFPFITLRPSSYWDNTEGHIYFQSLNEIGQEIKAFYGFFKPKETVSKQTLFYLKDNVNGDSFEIFIQSNKINYVLNTFRSGSSFTILSANIDFSSEYISAGIDISRFVRKYGGKLAAFFGSKQKLSFYVAGSDKLVNTFTGYIYRVGFCTARNLLKIADLFSDDNGTVVGPQTFEKGSFAIDGGKNPQAVQEETLDAGDDYFGNSSLPFSEVLDGGGTKSILETYIIDHIASYTLVPKILIGNFKLDIAVNGYWQDYVPLSYFSKYVLDNNGKKAFSMDFLQFNLSYPARRNFINQSYDTSDSIIKTYISFMDSRSTTNINPITNVVPLPEHGVVYPTNRWRSEKYEVVNDTIVYPPKDLEIRRASIVFHVEILSRGIEETPVELKSIQIASQALNTSVANSVGTKYGVDIYPYRNVGFYQDYKLGNPFSIFKGSMPYLYMTSTSGIRLRNVTNDRSPRYISIPVNKDFYKEYLVSAIQFAIRSGEGSFSSTAELIFEVQSNTIGGPHIKFYMMADNLNGTRAKIYGINAKTGLPQDGIMYYVNGKKVRNITINPSSWATIGITFASPQDFSGRQGEIKLSGSAMFNNISHYTVSSLDNLSRVSTRKWFSLPTRFGTWQNVEEQSGPENSSGNWGDVLFISVAAYEQLGGDKLFKKLTSTDRIIFDSDKILLMKDYQYKAYTDIIWQQNTAPPV